MIHCIDDLARVDSPEIDRRDPEIRVPERRWMIGSGILRAPSRSHAHAGVVGREPPSDIGLGGEPTQPPWAAVPQLDVVVDRARELDASLPSAAVEQLDLHPARSSPSRPRLEPDHWRLWRDRDIYDSPQHTALQRLIAAAAKQASVHRTDITAIQRPARRRRHHRLPARQSAQALHGKPTSATSPGGLTQGSTCGSGYVRPGPSRTGRAARLSILGQHKSQRQ